MAELDFAPHGNYGETDKEAATASRPGDANKPQSKDTVVSTQIGDASNLQAEVILHYQNLCPGLRKMPFGDPVDLAGRTAIEHWAQNQKNFQDIVDKAQTPEGLAELEKGLNAEFQHLAGSCYKTDGVEIRSLKTP
jgi:hypothetical protein